MPVRFFANANGAGSNVPELRTTPPVRLLAKPGAELVPPQPPAPEPATISATLSEPLPPPPPRPSRRRRYSTTRVPRSSMSYSASFSCNNCVHFAGDCEARGIIGDRLPCARAARHGDTGAYFSPVTLPASVAELQLDALTTGEVALIMWRARKILTHRINNAASRFQLGQHVQADDLHGGVLDGVVVRVNQRSLAIALDNGTVITMPADLAAPVPALDTETTDGRSQA
jgi:hypothetical protein